MLGRCDIRRCDAVPQGGSVGAPGEISRGHAEPLAADAAALRERRRLCQLSRQRGALFVDQAAKAGIDVFRVFDCLNWVDNMRVAIEAVLESGALCEAAICYSGNLSNPRESKYDLEYYLDIASLKGLGAHVIAVKDMAGLCQPRAAFDLVKALKEEWDCRSIFTLTTRAASPPPACSRPWRPVRMRWMPRSMPCRVSRRSPISDRSSRRCASGRATRSSTRTGCVSSRPTGSRCGAVTSPSKATFGRELPRSTYTACRAASTRISRNRRGRSASTITAGPKWPSLIPR